MSRQSTSKQNQPAKIVMMEDNAGDVLLLRLALDQTKEEYTLEVLRDGAEAIRFIEEEGVRDEQPCVIVLDLHMPFHDGGLVLQAIKNNALLSRVHVVVLTTLATPAEESEVQELGVRLYRSKPTELDGWYKLADEILGVCREPQSVAA